MEEGSCKAAFEAGLPSVPFIAVDAGCVVAARSDLRTGTAGTEAGVFGADALPDARTGITGATLDNCGCTLSVVLTGGSCVLVVCWALAAIVI